jgi:hypothetical protein
VVDADLLEVAAIGLEAGGRQRQQLGSIQAVAVTGVSG